MNFKDVPVAGISVCSTMGLSEYELRDDKNNKLPVRIELLSALQDDTDFAQLTEDASDKEMFYENILFYLACHLIGEPEYVNSGDVWINLLSSEYQAITDHSDMEHLFFMPPIFLTDKLKSIDINGHKINWLLCVPISEAELNYRDEKGPDALQQLLVENKIDVSDLFRKSVL